MAADAGRSSCILNSVLACAQSGNFVFDYLFRTAYRMFWDLGPTESSDFEFGSGLKITITHEGGKLFVDSPGAGKTELHPQSESIFAIGDSPANLEFIREVDGSCKQVVFHQSGFDVKLARAK